MRTAEDYIAKNMILFDCDELVKLNIIHVINRARTDIIKECAERAEVKDNTYAGEIDFIVDQDSILNLIPELK